MIKNNKQLIIIILSFGIGTLFTSWLTTPAKTERSTITEQQLENTNINLARLETAFDNLSKEIQQLQLTVSNNERNNSAKLGQIAAINTEEIEPHNDDIPSCDNTVTAEIPSGLELQTVTLVVDKLRAGDTYTYPDFPSLMTSPEVAGLGKPAMDQMMHEVSRMLENGEISPSFFPQQ